MFFSSLFIIFFVGCVESKIYTGEPCENSFKAIYDCVLEETEAEGGSAPQYDSSATELACESMPECMENYYSCLTNAYAQNDCSTAEGREDAAEANAVCTANMPDITSEECQENDENGENNADDAENNNGNENETNDNTNTDTDTNTDTNTDTTTDTTTDEGFDCTDSSILNPSNINECYTHMLNCGDSLTMTTSGGTSFYDNDQYGFWLASSSVSADYSGRERAFYFIHPAPANGIARFQLESPCEDMNLMYFRTWNEEECYPDTCSPCQADNGLSENSGHSDDEVVIYDSNDNSYLIIVESRSGVNSPFTLSVYCE